MTTVALADLPLPGLAAGHERLGHRVWRVRLDESSPVRTLIAKGLAPEAASRVELVARRWLPAIGLAAAGPPLLRAIPATSAGLVWHLYEDLGDWALVESGEDDDRLRALVDLVARIHGSFESHALLGEVQARARDLRATVHASKLHEVVRALAALRPRHADAAALRDRLVARFTGFLEEAPARAALLRELGGPDTLLHGDLWPKNGVVVPTPAGLRARLIDWDLSGVGSAVYDLSTLLSRVPEEVRGRVLRWYQEQDGPLAGVLSSRDDVNLLAETCERTRLAEWSLWRTYAVDSSHDDWAWRGLDQVEPWLDVPPLFTERSESA